MPCVTANEKIITYVSNVIKGLIFFAYDESSPFQFNMKRFFQNFLLIFYKFVNRWNLGKNERLQVFERHFENSEEKPSYLL